MLRSIILSLAMFVSLLNPVKADVVYSFVWGPFGIVANWSFEAPSLLTATTDVLDADLLTSFYGSGTITHVTIGDPLSSLPTIRTSYTGGGSFSDFGFNTPFDHLGTYTSQDGSVLTISEAASVVPEPGSLALLGLGLAGLAAIRKRKQA